MRIGQIDHEQRVDLQEGDHEGLIIDEPDRLEILPWCDSRDTAERDKVLALPVENVGRGTRGLTPRSGLGGDSERAVGGLVHGELIRDESWYAA